MENTVIVIFGPTGVGKTKTAVQLAKELNGEIISCDSMQVFTKMDKGTAKVTVSLKKNPKVKKTITVKVSDKYR